MDNKKQVMRWLDQHSTALATVTRWCESAALLLLLVGGGAALGYFFAFTQFRDYAAQQRADHQAEVQRLQTSITALLENVAPQLTDAARSSAGAAQDAKAAAESAASAASAKPVH